MENTNIKNDTKLEDKLNEAKKIKIESLLKEGYYIDLNFCNIWLPAYIYKVLEDNKYEIIFSKKDSLQKLTLKYSNKISYFLEHNLLTQFLPSNDSVFSKEEEENNFINTLIQNLHQNIYKPYELVQIFNGKVYEKIEQLFLHDDFEYIIDNVIQYFNLFNEITDIVINNYKTFEFLKKNRIIILTDHTSATLSSYQSWLNIIINMFTKVNEFTKFQFTNIKTKIIPLLYQKYVPGKQKPYQGNDLRDINYNIFKLFIYYLQSQKVFQKIIRLITNKDIITALPIYVIQSIYNFLYFISDLDDKIYKDSEQKIYEGILYKIQNLTEFELKDIKDSSTIVELLEYLEYILNKRIPFVNEKMINLPYYQFILKCLQSQSLEKRINAINSINEHIELLHQKQNNIPYFVEFISENKVIEILLGENVHDELLKRSISFFDFLARITSHSYNVNKKCNSNNKIIGIPEFTYDLLWDNYLNKHESVSSQIEAIINQIASKLPDEYRFKLYSKLKSYSNLLIAKSPKKYFNFLENLTENCLKNYMPLTLNESDDIETAETKLYGLPLLLKYTKDYITDENNNPVKNTWINITLACNSINNLIKNNEIISPQVMKIFLEKLILNIKNNNDVLQSILLFKKIIKNCYTERDQENREIIEYLDNKYDLLSLIIENLNLFLANKHDNKLTNELLFYNLKSNIINRIKFLFFFTNNEYCDYVLDFKGEEHLKKLYDSFISYAPEDISILYEYIMLNLKYFEKELINYYFDNLITNEKYFNPQTITQNQLNVFIEVFKKTNIQPQQKDYYDDDDEDIDTKVRFVPGDTEYPLMIDDRQNIRVVTDKIKGMETLFKLLIQIEDIGMKDILCELLSELCLNLCIYKNFASEYWLKYFNTLMQHLKNEYNSNNSTGISGLIKLIKKIYEDCIDEGKIPTKEEAPSSKNPCELYKFCYKKDDRKYRIKVNNYETIYDVRWKIGYYYDFPLNSVVIYNEKKNKMYSRLDDFVLFKDEFNPENFIYVDSKLGILSDCENSPKKLIENNSELLELLLSLLHNGNANYISDIWKIIHLIPKKYFIGDKYKFLGEANKNSDDFDNIFDSRSKYVQTFSLDSINSYLEEKLNNDNNKEKEYLTNFNNNFNANQKLISILYSLIDTDIQKQEKINYECLSSLLKLLIKIFSLLTLNENNLLSQLTVLIKKLLSLSILYDKDNINNHLKKNCDTIFDNFLNSNKDISSLDDDIKLSFSNYSCEEFINYEEKSYWKLQAKIFEEIFDLIDILILNENTGNNYIEILLNNQKDNFCTIFIENLIQLNNPYLKCLLFNYLNNNVNKHKNICMLYLELSFNFDILNFINKNDLDGSYLTIIVQILKQNIVYISDIKDNDIFINVSKQIISFISSFTNHQAKLIKGYLSLLYYILRDNSNVIDYVINNYDVYNILLKSCVLSKCDPNPLKCSENKCCLNAVLMVYKIIKVLCKKNENLLNKIITELSKYHTLGFWKTKKLSDWRINYISNNKGHFVGLQNLGCTCYMNSILQQIFMIPELRKAVLSYPLKSKEIFEQNKNNLQNCKSAFIQFKNLMASLQYYESQYFTPNSFAENFDNESLDITEQMDADEFYGRLIDKLEEFVKNDDDYKNMFKYFFGGYNVDELLFKDCGHKRENEFFYNNIQLQVSGKHNLEESLASYVQGEMMEGDNSIFCEECKKKMAALKRQSIKTLSKTLVIVLKRFEFDYDTMLKMKLNDFFAFPKELDMYPYTQEGINNKDPNKKVLYDLTGVVIHMGTSESGHYYSLIKDVNSNDNEWYEFNDTSVKPFDIDDLASEAFGGTDVTYNRLTGKNECSEKAMNAYILLYHQRESNIPNKFQLNISNDISIEDEILNPIKTQMYHYWVLKSISSEFYQNFVLELLKLNISSIVNFPFRNDYLENNTFNSNLPKRGLDVLKSNIVLRKDENVYNNNFDSMNLFQFGITYFFNVVIRCKSKTPYFEYMDVIKTYINSDCQKAIWIIEEFSNIDTLNEFIVYNPILSIKKIIIGLLFAAAIKISKDKQYLEVLFNFAKALLYIIKLKFKYKDLDYIYFTFIRLMSASNDVCQFLNDNYNLNNILISYFNFQVKDNQENEGKTNALDLTDICISLEDIKKSTHSQLSIKTEGQINENKPKANINKNERYLKSMFIMLISNEDLLQIFENKNYEILQMIDTKFNSILLSKKLFEVIRNDIEKSKTILELLIIYINIHDADEIELEYIILKKILFNLDDTIRKERLKYFFDKLPKIFTLNKKYYYYIDKLYAFILNLYNEYFNDMVEFQSIINTVMDEFYKFYKENPVPPKYFMSNNKVVVYKSPEKNKYQKVNAYQYNEYIEKYTKNSLQHLDNITNIKTKNIKNLQENLEPSYFDEDFIDFKFIEGDKVFYEGKVQTIRKVIDEQIIIESKEKERSILDTDDELLEIFDFKNE